MEEGLNQGAWQELNQGAWQNLSGNEIEEQQEEMTSWSYIM